MSHDPLLVLAVLAVNLALAEVLTRRTFCRHFGTALLVILITAVTANAGLIPTGTHAPPLYGHVFAEVAPLSIFLLLLRVHLGDVARAGFGMVGLFLAGAVGTMLGVCLGMWLVDGATIFGEYDNAIGGMFVGTYVGGSLNFNLIALHYGVAEQGALYTGAVVVDNIMTTIWMVVTIIVPRGLGMLASRRGRRPSAPSAAPLSGVEDDTESIHPLDAAVLIALAAGSLWFSERVAEAFAARGVAIPSVVLLTTLALLLAHVPPVRRLRGSRTLGMLGVYLFLAVIGAYCDLTAFGALGTLGPRLLLFVTVAVLVHGLVVFGVAGLLRVDKDIAAVASQANVGGGTSALALARSLGRADLVLPAVLVGSVGTALGTYLGFLVAEFVL